MNEYCFSSSIQDRQVSVIDNSILSTDITHRKQYESQLQQQRDELKHLEQLNTTIRSVNTALVSATSCEEIMETVCDQLVDSQLYAATCVGDIATWNGDVDRWKTASSSDEPELTLPEQPSKNEREGWSTINGVVTDSGWNVVYISYNRTLYGVIGVATARDSIPDSELAVLRELGEIVGHTIDAVECRQLLQADSLVRVELESTVEDSLLATVASESECSLKLDGWVPTTEGSSIAYIRFTDGHPDAVQDAFERWTDNSVRLISTEGTTGLIEWTPGNETVLAVLNTGGTRIRGATAETGVTRYVIEVGCGGQIRQLLDRIRVLFPGTEMVKKIQENRQTRLSDPVEDDATDLLTDRQREALEIAHRAGYFEWPRQSTAEEIAEILDISRPTLQAHLRKAEQRLFEQVFADKWLR